MQTYHLSLYRGDTYSRAFVLWADAEKTDPADLTGVAVAAEARTASGASPVVTLPLAVTDNVIALTIDPALSRALPASALWDLQLTYPSGAVVTIVSGSVRVRDDITGSGA